MNDKAITFQDLKINKFVLNALDELGFEKPTPIQEKVFSTIKSGKDVLGIAQTGTGKTFAYLLPLLSVWQFTKNDLPQILIIVPTRELVVQVVDEIEKLSVYLSLKVVGVYGGVNMKRHRDAMAQKLDIVVGTPGRLMDLIFCRALQTKNIKSLVLDEVDEMLNLGFRTQLKNLLDLLPSKRQNLMFSATFIPAVEEIVKMFSPSHEKIEAAPPGAPLENISQLYFEAPNFLSKKAILLQLLTQDKSIQKALIFVSSRKKADVLAELLDKDFEDKFGVIHSSKSQNYRFRSIQEFEKGEYQFLIATDLVARGLDFDEITHVINFDLPKEAEAYIHRIGRTGRAKSKGNAISFVAEEEKDSLNEIEDLMSLNIPLQDLIDGVEFTNELLPMEQEKDHLAIDNFYKVDNSNANAFHEKKEKNKKVNKRRDYKEEKRLKRQKRRRKR